MKYKKTLITTTVVGMLLSGSAIAKAEPASAEKNTGAAAVSSGFKQAPALAYNYYAGHPMYFSKGKFCTGSWTIYGGSGSFILTAGHCGGTGMVVSGTQLPFGVIAASREGASSGDSALVRYYPGVTPYQIVVNPLNGQTPGNGRVTGIMRNRAQTPGKAVGKMGVKTGWTEGVILGKRIYNGRKAIIAYYFADYGDSGGPVWRYDTKLRAVGMHVAGVVENGIYQGGIYYTIEDLLAEWGANISTFTARGAASEPEPSLAVEEDINNIPEQARKLYLDLLEGNEEEELQDWAARHGYEILEH